MNRIKITLTDNVKTSLVPLAAFGYALRRAGLLKPLQQSEVPIKTLQHTPGDKVIEALVLILAGGRSTAQIDLLLRPNRLLAQAWGQEEFAQQATVADTLDAFDQEATSSLRRGFETLLQQQARALHHDFRTGPLWLDGDLTGLPASRRAEGSQLGYFPGEKNARGASSLV
jgi:hypothetical protein